MSPTPCSEAELKANGVTDETAAINAAIAYGGNCCENCLTSSAKGTLIYFPPGTYLISTPINTYCYSQLGGDVSCSKIPTRLCAGHADHSTNFLFLFNLTLGQ